MLVSDALHKLSHEETPLKSCQADMELHSGLLRLATLLARKPCLQLQLVGPQGQVVAQGAAPLALLLQQATLQGGAPLFDVSHGKPSAANIRQQKQVGAGPHRRCSGERAGPEASASQLQMWLRVLLEALVLSC